jgi:predicted CXXCH cytochrome family protein
VSGRQWAAWIAIASFAGATFAVATFGRRLGWWRSAPGPARQSSYIDAKQCQACHAAIQRDYRQVGMARSFAPAPNASPIEAYARNNHFLHALSGRHYQVLRRGGRLFQRRYEVDSRGTEVNVFEQEATYAVGSGNHARTYLHQSESGELTELPITWYTQEASWGMSPGYDNGTPPDFTRLVEESCLFCHNGYPVVDGARSEGIDCQRCHGPGSRHVELASGGKVSKPEIQAAIVNPARLSPALQMDVCMQCHLETTSADLPGMIRRFNREPFSFRPGEPLGAYMVYFDQPPGAGRPDRFEIVNQAYRLRQSLCFQKSQGRLVCTTCHDPHNVPRGADAVKSYRNKCVSCHGEVTVPGHPTIDSADCASCHMPRRRTEDAVHIVMTDHLIARKPPLRHIRRPIAEHAESYRGPLNVYYPESLPQDEREVYLGVAMITGSADRPGGIGLLEKHLQAGISATAMAVLGEGYLSEGSIQKSIEVFRRAAGEDPSLAKARYNLGQALEAAGRTQEARSEYQQAIRMRVRFPEAQHALANLLVKAGDTSAAIEHYLDAIRARPVYAEAHSNLANLYADRGRLDEARSELEQALRVNPAFAEAHNNLARVLAAQKRVPEALDHARRAVVLNPDFAEARYNLGRLLQETGSHEAAIAEYRKTLVIRPDLAEAHLSLGQALADAGRLDAAIAEFREVLRLRPGHAEAQRNLEMALALKGGGRP